jgi:branched-chain amino acid transport system ATP-binding protein
VEVGLAEREWEKPMAALDAVDRLSVRLGRAVALDPGVLLLEHPTASLDRQTVPAVAARVRSVAAGRGAAVIALTADRAFADALGGRILELDPATGKIAERGGRRWLGRWLG